MNANSFRSEKVITPTETTVKAVEDFGCASDCVTKSKNLIQATADFMEKDPNDYVQDGTYMQMYTTCYNMFCN